VINPPPASPGIITLPTAVHEENVQGGGIKNQ
jgi:hypothetical protein